MTEWLILVAALVVGVPAAAWLLQDRMIFYPQPVVSSAHLPRNTSPLEIVALDGTRLRGWLRAAPVDPATARAAPAVLYFGGNAEEVSWTLADRRWPTDWSIVAINYRGYGASEGSPSEKALVSDARRIHDVVAARPDIDAERIVVFGRSLGSAVAVALAAQRPVAGVILASPFDSLTALGQAHFRWLPVSWLLRHRFESLPWARVATVPLLSIVAHEDSIVPRERSLALHEAWAGPKTLEIVPRTGHNTLSEPDEYWEAVVGFLRSR